jgi:hypothetical protein
MRTRGRGNGAPRWIGGGALATGALLIPGLALGGLRQAIQDKPPVGESRAAPTRVLNTIKDVSLAFRACWVPPSIDEARPGMQLTLIVSFNRAGAIIGEPRFSYFTPEATSGQRDIYRRAALAALDRCAPLRFTPALGGALAGRPFAIRFIDDRTIRPSGRQI